MQPTHNVIFGAILGLKHAQNPENDEPTRRWFKTWWKENNLHKITTKPLAVIRFTAAQDTDVKT